MVCKSAKPKPAEEAQGGLRGFALLAAVLSLITPLLLARLPFRQRRARRRDYRDFRSRDHCDSGWLVHSCCEVDVGAVFDRAAPILAVPVFLLALYVSWENGV